MHNGSLIVKSRHKTGTLSCFHRKSFGARPCESETDDKRPGLIAIEQHGRHCSSHGGNSWYYYSRKENQAREELVLEVL